MCTDIELQCVHMYTYICICLCVHVCTNNFGGGINVLIELFALLTIKLVISEYIVKGKEKIKLFQVQKYNIGKNICTR